MGIEHHKDSTARSAADPVLDEMRERLRVRAMRLAEKEAVNAPQGEEPIGNVKASIMMFGNGVGGPD